MRIKPYRKVSDRQFVLGIGYSYTFSNQVTGKNRNPVYFKGSLEFSGNTVYALQSLFQTEKGTPENPFELFPILIHSMAGHP